MSTNYVVILINLLKSYCCSLYGSMLWKYNSEGFDKICKSWNIAKEHYYDYTLFNAHYLIHII